MPNYHRLIKKMHNKNSPIIVDQSKEITGVFYDGTGKIQHIL